MNSNTRQSGRQIHYGPPHGCWELGVQAKKEMKAAKSNIYPLWATKVGKSNIDTTRFHRPCIFILLPLLISFNISTISFFKNRSKTLCLSLSKMSDSESLSKAYQYLHIVPNPDGTLTRLPEFYPTVPPSADTSSSAPSLSRETPINHFTGTWARLYLPRPALFRSNSDSKLPILIFIHGGGFVVSSAAHPRHHEFCNDAASQLGALIISLEYRLAPEHRLPAAYDDAVEGLTWVRDGKDEWVTEFGDLSRCVMMGESAGGTIVYHAGLRAADMIEDLKPLIIKGLVLLQPYFGGSERTASELRLINDPALPLDSNELMWSLALPVGASRSHEYCDPTVGGGSGLLNRVRDSEWPVGVIASDGDPMYDRDVELVKLMETRGVRVRSMLSKGVSHGDFVSDLAQRNDLYDFLMDFLS